MTAYKGRNRRIKDALVTILTGINYDPGGTGAEPAFVSVLDNTKDKFEGYPAVTILPNNLGSATGSNTEKEHTVDFAIFTHLPVEDSNTVESALYNQMYDLTDLIIDTLEHADFINTLGTADPTIQNLKMEVPQTRWFIAQGKSGGLLIVNVDVQITYSIDVH